MKMIYVLNQSITDKLTHYIMHNQRILYSSRKQRDNTIPSGNKENNLKMFNHQVKDDCREGGSNMGMMRHDYDGKKRMASRGKNSQLMVMRGRENNTMREQSFELLDDRATSHLIPEANSPVFSSVSTIPRLSEQQLKIQAYTNKLLQLNTTYQEQMIQLKQQLTALRSQHERIIAENIKYRVTMEKRQQESSGEFNQQIQRLVVELKEILAAKEQMEVQYNNYIGQLVEQHTNELLHKTQQLAKAEEFFRQKLSSYKSTLTTNNQQTQKLYFEASESKLKLIKQIDQLNYSLDKEKGAKRQFQQANQDLVKIVKQLQKDNAQTKHKLQVKEMEVFRIEKEKNEIIIHLKLQNKQLTQINTNLQHQLQQTNTLLSTKTSQLADNQNQLTLITNQLQEVTKKLVQKNYQLQQEKGDKAKSREAMGMKIQGMGRQLDKYQTLVAELQTTVKRLSEDNAQKQAVLQHNQQQLTSANTQLQSLHLLQSKLTKQVFQLEELNKKYKSDNIDLLQQLQLSNLQNKSLKQDKLSKENQLKVLQQMCERLQNKLKAGDRKGEDEVNKLIQENECLRKEIEFICQQYERKLSQKEVKWQNRVQAIENQIQALMRQKMMVRKQLIYEHPISSDGRQLKSPMIIKNSPNQVQYLNSDKIKQNYFNDNLTIQKQKVKYYQQAQKRLSEFRNSRRQ